MDKNLKNQPGFTKAASGGAPSGAKDLSPAPGGGKVKNISGPSVHTKNSGGDLNNNNGIDGGTSVISS